MRTFYIYNINDLFSSVYEEYPYKLYKMISDAYYTNKHDIALSANYYEQIITKFNKLYINNYLIANNKVNSYYYQKNNIHLISNNKEYSKIMVSSYCLKLKSNLNYPSFFDNIKAYSDNIFICDFENGDYFWLNKVTKVEKSCSK